MTLLLSGKKKMDKKSPKIDNSLMEEWWFWELMARKYWGKKPEDRTIYSAKELNDNFDEVIKSINEPKP